MARIERKINGRTWVYYGEEADVARKPNPKLKYIKSGIYVIEVSGSMLIYVGQSVNFASRWSQHRNTLRAGRCGIPGLQEIWDADPSRVSFRIIEETSEDLRVKEKAYAEKFVLEGYTLMNDYFIMQPTNMITEKAHAVIFQRMMKLAAKGRFNFDEFEKYLDTL